jgi:hypothetical protein
MRLGVYTGAFPPTRLFPGVAPQLQEIGLRTVVVDLFSKGNDKAETREGLEYHRRD